MDEIKKILDASNAPDDVKRQALIVATQVAAPLAGSVAKGAAFGDGTFLQFFLEIIKQLLPILLQMLFPTS